MLPRLKPSFAVFTFLGLSIVVAVGCGEVGPPTSVHGDPGLTGIGRASVVQITPPALAIEEGTSAPLMCLVMDSRGLVLSTTPAWNTSDAGVVTVSSRGVVSAQRAGTATVTCESGGKSATAAITVAQSAVAFIEVSPGAGTVLVGNTLQLSATPRDVNGEVLTGREVKWVSVDSSVAGVTSGGTVIGRVEGSANVVASVGGLASLARIHVQTKVPEPVASIALRLDDTTLAAGQLTHVTATTKDSTGQTLNGRSLTWTVSDPRVASVATMNADKASIFALAPGTTLITASSEGKSVTKTFTVLPSPVQTISVSLDPTKVLPGQTTQASATIKDASGSILTDRTATWTTLDSRIATVSSAGVVTGVSTGAVIVRATSGGKTGDASMTVGVPAVSEVAVTLGASNLSASQTTIAIATPKDAAGNVLTGRSVAWSSLTPSVATVSIAGVVTAVANGTSIIRATVEGITGDATLTVGTQTPTVATVATVSVSVVASSLLAGATTTATAVARDASGNLVTGRPVVWSSLAPSVATVSGAGVVTAMAAGTATIRATVDTKTGDGSVVVAAVTVPPPPPPSGLAGEPAAPQTLQTGTAVTPSNGRTLRVSAGGNLQQALDTAVSGDRILLAAGATFTGNFVLPAKAGGGIAGGWITVQSDGTIPAEGTRMSVSTAAGLSVPRVQAPNLLPAIQTAVGAARWRLIGFEVTVAPGVTFNQGLVLLGDGTTAQTVAATIPRNIILDRMYVHGTPTLDLRRCVALNSRLDRGHRELP